MIGYGHGRERPSDPVERDRGPGIGRGKAERIASVIVDLIHDSVATKADVRGAEARHAAPLHGLE
jgi:hypothetical protein